MRKRSFGQTQETIFEALVEALRLHLVTKEIKENITLVDFGCGYNANLLSKYANIIKKGIGLDLHVGKPAEKNIKLYSQDLKNKTPIKSNSVDTVTAVAVLEHLSYPDKAIKEAYRILKPGGKLVITTPSIYSKPVLEFLSYKLHLISYDEISDHKQYYSKALLEKSLEEAGFKQKNIKVRYFEMGFNIFARVVK